MHHSSHNVNHTVFKSDKQDPSIDLESVAAANRRFDQQNGFSTKDPGAGLNRLRYPPYVPALPGYFRPEGHAATESTTARIQAWHHVWFAEHFPQP